MHGVVDDKGLILQDLQERLDVHREVVDDPGSAFGGDLEEPDPVFAGIKAGSLGVVGDDFRLLDLGDNCPQVVVSSDEDCFRIWLQFIVMSVITVTTGRIRLFYRVFAVTVLRPPTCAERHVIVISVIGGSGFPIGFFAIMTLMTLIYRSFLKEALLPFA